MISRKIGDLSWEDLTYLETLLKNQYSKELEQDSDQGSDDAESELERIVRPIMLPSLGEIQGMVRQIIDEREEADLQLAILASMSSESSVTPETTE